jgi:hypothetical protein
MKNNKALGADIVTNELGGDKSEYYKGICLVSVGSK